VLEIRQLTAAEAPQQIGALADTLLDCVAGGASVSFMASFSRADAQSFFASVFEDLQRNGRILLAAFLDSELVGTVQILTAMPPNQTHRADIAKLSSAGRLAGKESPVNSCSTLKKPVASPARLCSCWIPPPEIPPKNCASV
jgi:hypothetical protein